MAQSQPSPEFYGEMGWTKPTLYLLSPPERDVIAQVDTHIASRRAQELRTSTAMKKFMTDLH